MGKGEGKREKVNENENEKEMRIARNEQADENVTPSRLGQGILPLPFLETTALICMVLFVHIFFFLCIVGMYFSFAFLLCDINNRRTRGQTVTIGRRTAQKELSREGHNMNAG